MRPVSTIESMFRHQMAAPAPIPWRSTLYVRMSASASFKTKLKNKLLGTDSAYDWRHVGLGRPEP